MLKPFYGALLGFAGLAAAGCASHTFSARSSAEAMPSLGQASANGRLSSTAFKVADNYAGSLTEMEGTHTRAGTVVMAINQQGTKISGTFDITFSSHTSDQTIFGTIKSQTKTEAQLSFTIFNPHGRNAKANATVTARGLVGKATVPPKGRVTLKFKTERK